MKGRIFLVLGGLAVAGFVAYEVYKHLQSDKTNEYGSSIENDGTVKKDGESPCDEDTTSASASDIYETRATVVHTVKERHSEAVMAMKESLNTIFNESDEDVITENSETLDKTSSELDDLLK